MWVQDNTEAKKPAQGSVWERLNPLSQSSNRSIPPVQIEVRWYDGWSMKNLTDHHFSRPEVTDLVNEGGSTDEDSDAPKEAGQEADELSADDRPAVQQESVQAAI